MSGLPPQKKELQRTMCSQISKKKREWKITIIDNCTSPTLLLRQDNIQFIYVGQK